MHAEHVGPEDVAFVSGRRRIGGTLTREGLEVVYGGQKAGHFGELHSHDFNARIMVLGGEITLTRDGKPETFRAGDHCEVPAGCMHSEQVGQEGVAYIAGKAYRQASA